MSRELSSFERDGVRTVLRVEEHEIPEDVRLSEHHSIITRGYELQAKPEFLDKVRFRSSYETNAAHPNGRVFRLEGPDSFEMHYSCRLTDRGPNGEIIVPDEPYDTGAFEIEPGDYHFWDESEYL